MSRPPPPLQKHHPHSFIEINGIWYHPTFPRETSIDIAEKGQQTLNYYFLFVYRPFHKTLPKSSVQMHWISVRFYEMDDTQYIHICVHISNDIS